MMPASARHQRPVVEIEQHRRVVVLLAALYGKSAHGRSLVATVRSRSAPTSLAPRQLAFPSTSDQANTVAPANSGATCRPPLIAAMWKALASPLNDSARASEMTWPP